MVSRFAVALCLSVSWHQQVALGADPDPRDLVREVRRLQAGKSYKISGVLSKGRKKVSFSMSVLGDIDTVRFRFRDPVQNISLVQKADRYRLTEQLAREEPKDLAQDRYGEKIRGMDITYEDLSQRYLYWPGAHLLGDEKIRVVVRHDAWVVQLDNPRRGFGPYQSVKIWVDKESGALLRILAHDWDGRPVKRFVVTKVHRDKEWGVLLERMRIETIDPKGNVREMSYMTLGKPERD